MILRSFRFGSSSSGSWPPGSPACRSGCPDRDRAIRRGFRLRLLRWQ